MTEEPIVSDEHSEPPEGANTSDGLIDRLRERGEELARGRRLTLPLPGWSDLGDGRGLWARFNPISRSAQQAFGWTPDKTADEIEFIAPMLAQLCEEILIGTREARTPLADEPEIASVRALDFPLGFSDDLGSILGIGGDSGPSVVKRMLIRGDDDIAFYAVWGELLGWSGTVIQQGVETAAGE